MPKDPSLACWALFSLASASVLLCSLFLNKLVDDCHLDQWERFAAFSQISNKPSLSLRYVHSGGESPSDSILMECTDGVKRVPFTLNVDVELVDDEKPKMTMDLPFGTLGHMLKVSDKIHELGDVSGCSGMYRDVA